MGRIVGEWAGVLLIFGVLLFLVFRPRARWPRVLSGLVFMKILFYYLVLPINKIPFLYVQLHDNILLGVWVVYAIIVGIIRIVDIDLDKEVNLGLYDFMLADFYVYTWVTVTRGVIIIGTWVIIIMVRRSRLESTVILIIGLGTAVMVSTIEWLVLYIVLEGVSMALYVLVASVVSRDKSSEAGMKFFLLGAIASGVFVLSCNLIYGITGELYILWSGSVIIGGISATLLTIALLFKLTVAPFHMWAPDVYEGVPLRVVVLLATLPKFGVFLVLLQFGPVRNLIVICTMVSMICGVLGALNQTKIKRMMAYSGINHMGFIIFGLVVGGFEGLEASLVYMGIYVITLICVFMLIMVSTTRWGMLTDFSLISRENPVLAWMLFWCFISLAGVPPLGGFLGKWLILKAGVMCGYYLLTIFAGISTAVSLVFYLRIARLIYFEVNWLDVETVWARAIKGKRKILLREALVIGATGFVVLFILLNPFFILDLAHEAATGLWSRTG